MDLAKPRQLAGLLSEYLGQVVSTGKPYSKSHAKRLKRKAKEELAGGTLADIQSAIAAVESDHKILGEGTFTEPPKNEPPQTSHEETKHWVDRRGKYHASFPKPAEERTLCLLL